MKRCHRKAAFTLIELLVVIAIIAIVAAILFPVFARAKASAKKTVAMSNLAQIGKSEHLYLGDNEDCLPFRYGDLPCWPGYDMIFIIISDSDPMIDAYSPYIKNRDLWYSPEDRATKKGLSSFAFNDQLSYSWSMSEIPRPSEAIYMMDRAENGLVPNQPPANVYFWWTFISNHPFAESKLPDTLVPANVVNQVSPNRYVGKVALYQFLDSHVKAMKFDQTWGDQRTNLHLATKP